MPQIENKYYKQVERATCSVHDVDALINLCKQLLDGADKCGEDPYYIVQPFLGIIKNNIDIIRKYELISDK